MPRPQPSRDDTRSQQIRAAAAKLFTQKGFAATTTDDIAREAGLSKATLYVRYSSKEELLADVLKDFLAQLSSLSFECEPGEPQAQLLRVAEHLLKALMNPHYLALMRVLIAELPHQPKLGGLFAQAIPLQVLRRVQGLLAHSLPGISADDPSFLAARGFVGPLLTYVLLDGLMSAEPGPPSRDALERLVTHYLNGVTGRKA